jgi:hypothetical protein
MNGTMQPRWNLVGNRRLTFNPLSPLACIAALPSHYPACRSNSNGLGRSGIQRTLPQLAGTFSGVERWRASSRLRLRPRSGSPLGPISFGRPTKQHLLSAIGPRSLGFSTITPSRRRRRYRNGSEQSVAYSVSQLWKRPSWPASMRVT